MTDRKFYESVVIVQILSERPIPDPLDALMRLRRVGVAGMVDENGEIFAGVVLDSPGTEIDGPATMRALRDIRIDPEVFGLDDQGDDVND